MATPLRIRWCRIFEGVRYMPLAHFHSRGQFFKNDNSQSKCSYILIERYTDAKMGLDED